MSNFGYVQEFDQKGKVDPNDIQGDFDWLNLLVLNSAETASPLG